MGHSPKKTVPKSTILCNVFRYILNSNIDKNFTIHDHAKFGYLSHDIAVRLIWTTRSSQIRNGTDKKTVPKSTILCSVFRCILIRN